MTEDNVPSEDVRKVIKYLDDNNLIYIDKIIIPITKLNFDFIKPFEQQKVLDVLFDIEVRMIDEGKESEIFYSHLKKRNENIHFR